MYLTKLSIIFTLALTLSLPALATFRVTALQEVWGGMESHALLRVSDRETVLIQTSTSQDGMDLALSSLPDPTARRERRPIPFSMLMLAAQAARLQNDVLIAGTDAQGGDRLILLDWTTRRVRKTALVSQLSLITAVASHDGFLVGGISRENTPLALQVDRNLNIVRAFDVAPGRRGEVQGFIQVGGRPCLIANFSDGTSQIYELDSDGQSRSVYRVPGAAATALALGKRGLAISFRNGEGAFLQILDSTYRPIETRPVLQVKGVATRTPTLVEFQDSVFWIGANDGGLRIHRFSLDGREHEEVTDSALSRYRVPHRRSYLASVVRGRLYIHGQSLGPKGDPAPSKYVEFRFALGR